uniref:Uncharacterized protein n=1 Tax=Araucaria cunninghamii TaxID=56994 RepID=A0A0D6QYV8_ARACU
MGPNFVYWCVTQYLEKRECEYDIKTYVDFYQEADCTSPLLSGVLVFTSTPCKVSNKYFLGPAPLEEMASQIAKAVGPCGNNRDYLFQLEKALNEIGHEDDEIIELANEVRKILGRIDVPSLTKMESATPARCTTFLPPSQFLTDRPQVSKESNGTDHITAPQVTLN